ncbi:MAG: DUF1016 family protein [Verrucomicrobia bacterium]|nr:DUF1016 family protein [Verrucomicrobiota bacterium]
MSKKRIVAKKPTSEMFSPKSYAKLLEQIKTDIRQTQLRSALSITKELIMLYWHIGKILIEKTLEEGWGAKSIERLSRDLKNDFPDITGFSVRNLQYMRKFSTGYLNANYAAAAAQIPWGHNMLLLDKIEDPAQRLWYVQQALNGGWSRSVLESWIESNLYERKGRAITNFKQTLPPIQSDMAEQALKDPYNLQFVTLESAYREKELEQGLMDHLQKFLVELGGGFAFMGRQYRIEVEGEDYWIDLLFYHVKLRCYVVIELKATAFDPRDAGQMNFYLSAVDDLIRHPEDQPTIGILLCKTKNRVKVEYALRRCSSPIGVSSYETKIIKNLPKNLQSKLPSVEEIEAELSTIETPVNTILRKLSKKKLQTS